MRRLKSINRFLCFVAASMLVGRVTLPDVCSPRPVAAAAALVRVVDSIPPADGIPPTDDSSCNAADASDVHLMFKGSVRAGPPIVSATGGGRALQAARSGLRAGTRASNSQVLWIETCTSSLNTRHVRMQI
jgi:hypothetical protein